MGDGKIVKIAKGAMHINAHKDIHFYAKNIHANAGSSVGETAEGGVVFGTPQTANWDMPNVEFPNHNYTPVAAKLNNQKKTNTPQSNPPKVQKKENKTKKKAEENNDCIKITIAVFFDGTGNNRYNTTARWLYKKRKYGTRGKNNGEALNDAYNENAHADEYKGNITGLGTQGNIWGGSYQNDLSNVARLEKFYDVENLAPTHVVTKVYVEGVGTQNGDDDDISSAKDGEGVSGIRAKIKSSIKDIGEKINLIVEERDIEELTFNVYGFSRGAATARNFVHEITQQKGAIKEKGLFKRTTYYKNKFGLLGEEIDTSKVEKMTINFAGLFETVSAHDKDGIDKGLFEDAHDDVEELHLKAINKAKKIVHFTAEDEHRKNFALTTTSKGLQKALPGVHSDVGGCYTNGKEFVVLIDGEPSLVKREAERLYAEGWYRKDKKQLKISVLKKEKNKDGKVVKIKKAALSGSRILSKNYSFIPLELMGILSNNETEINIVLQELDKFYNIHSTDPNKDASNKDVKALNAKQKQLLTYVRERLHNFVLRNDIPMVYYTKKELENRINDFEYITMKKDSEALYDLRNQFLHFSSDISVLSPGMDPNIIRGKRTRKVFHG